MQKKILLIGLGKIGWNNGGRKEPSFNNDFLNSKNHFDAALAAKCEIVGAVEINTTVAKEFSIATNLPTWSSIRDVPKNIIIDICIICTPDNTHYRVLKEILENLEIRGIVCEKPFGINAQESAEMIELSKKHAVPILVNYTRHFSNGFTNFLDFTKNDEFIEGHFTYSHSLRRNGSHFLNLVIEVLGVPKSIDNFSGIGYKDNPTFRLIYENKKFFYFYGMDSNLIQTGDAIFVFKEKTIRIIDSTSFKVRKISSKFIFPLWNDQLDLIFEGTLSFGLDNIYRLNWNSEEFKQELNQLMISSLECNKIIDSLQY